MAQGTLGEFIASHRDDILARARGRVLSRRDPAATQAELTTALPAFLDQLHQALRKASSNASIDHTEIMATAAEHGGQRFLQGLTVGQVVHDYGDICQIITGLANERTASVSIDEFQTLNLCLDDAIAGAVTAFRASASPRLPGKGPSGSAFSPTSCATCSAPR